jgi:hypothetical protein
MTSDRTGSPFASHVPSAHDSSYSSELSTSTLQSLLQSAVRQYEKKVGTSLIDNQFAIRLRSCDTIKSITEVLEERAQEFRGFLGQDRHPKMMTSIRRTVHVLHTFFTGPGTGFSSLNIGSAVRPNTLIVLMALYSF